MYVHVRVHAGAKKEEFVKLSDTHFRAAVREPAEQNQANRRVCALVAAHFKITPNAVRILNGHHSPSKLLSVEVGG